MSNLDFSAIEESRTHLQSQFLHANGQDYRIVAESELKDAAQSLLDCVEKLRAECQLQAHQTLCIYVIAGTEQRRQDMLKALPSIDPTKKIVVATELFPFNFHSYKFRGRTSAMIVVDNTIATEYFAGFNRDSSNNHQLTLNHTLSTVCYCANKAYSELYLIV